MIMDRLVVVAAPPVNKIPPFYQLSHRDILIYLLISLQASLCLTWYISLYLFYLPFCLLKPLSLHLCVWRLTLSAPVILYVSLLSFFSLSFCLSQPLSLFLTLCVLLSLYLSLSVSFLSFCLSKTLYLFLSLCVIASHSESFLSFSLYLSLCLCLSVSLFLTLILSNSLSQPLPIFLHHVPPKNLPKDSSQYRFFDFFKSPLRVRISMRRIVEKNFFAAFKFPV